MRPVHVGERITIKGVGSTWVVQQPGWAYDDDERRFTGPNQWPYSVVQAALAHAIERA